MYTVANIPWRDDGTGFAMRHTVAVQTVWNDEFLGVHGFGWIWDDHSDRFIGVHVEQLDTDSPQITGFRKTRRGEMYLVSEGEQLFPLLSACLRTERSAT